MIGLLLAFAAGAGLSVFYFGGLWLTVQRVAEARRPKLLLLGSFFGRAAVILVGFYLVIVAMGDRWELLVASLLGFILARSVLVRRWGPPTAGAQPA